MPDRVSTSVSRGGMTSSPPGHVTGIDASSLTICCSGEPFSASTTRAALAVSTAAEVAPRTASTAVAGSQPPDEISDRQFLANCLSASTKT